MLQSTSEFRTFLCFFIKSTRHDIMAKDKSEKKEKKTKEVEEVVEDVEMDDAEAKASPPFD